MDTVVLILHPHIEPGGYHLDKFDAYLDDELILTSRSPLYSGARELLKRGLSPDALLTIRHVGKAYDSFKPQPIGELAKWTVVEGRNGLSRQAWSPFPVARRDEIASGSLALTPSAADSPSPATGGPEKSIARPSADAGGATGD
jgi:hypothetical protein